MPEDPQPRKKDPQPKVPEAEQLPFPKPLREAAPPALRLELVAAVLLQAGEGRALEVRVRRENCDGAVRLVLNGLPAGASARPTILAPDQDTVRIDLKTDADADDAAANVTVRADLGALRAEQEFRLSLQSRPSLRLVALTDVTVHAGQVRSFGVRVVRRRCPGPIELRLMDLPEDVTAWRGLIPAERDRSGLTFTVRKEARLGMRKVRVVAAGAGLRAERTFALTVGPPHSVPQRLLEDTDALNRAPNDAIAWQNRAHTQRELGEYQKAIADYNKALDLDPDSTPTHVCRGNAHFDRKDYNRAIDDFARAAAKDIELRGEPNYVLAHLLRGDLRFARQDYRPAIEDYSDALELNPKDPLTWTKRGNAHRDARAYKPAIEDYDQAIRLNVNFTLAYRNRGRAWNLQREYDNAIADLDKAIALDPTNPRPYHGRGFAHAKKREYREAIADFTKAINRDPTNPGPRRDRGDAYIEEREYDNAIADFKAAIARNGKDAALFNSLGAAHAWKKEWTEAIANYTRAIALRPNYSLAYSNRASAYEARRAPGDQERAREDRERAARFTAVLTKT